MGTKFVDPTMLATVYTVTTHIGPTHKKLRERPPVMTAHWTLKSAQDHLRVMTKSLMRMHDCKVQEVKIHDDCSVVMARNKRLKEPILVVSKVDQLDILPHGKKHNHDRDPQEFDHWDEDGSEEEASDSETGSGEDDDNEDRSDKEQRSYNSSSSDAESTSSTEGGSGTESSGPDDADRSGSDLISIYKKSQKGGASSSHRQARGITSIVIAGSVATQEMTGELSLKAVDWMGKQTETAL